MSTINTFSCRSCHGQLVYEGSVDEEVVCPHCNNQVRLEEVQSPKAPPESKPSSEVRQNRSGLKNRTSSLTFAKRPPQEEEPDTAPLPPPAPPGSASLGNHRRNPGARPGNSGVAAWLIVGICLPLAFLFMVLLTHLGFWAVKDTETYVWIGVLLVFILAFVAFGSSNVPSSLQDTVHWILLLGASVAVLGGYYTGKAKGAKQTAYSSPFDVVERFFESREKLEALDYMKSFKSLNLESLEVEALKEMISEADDGEYRQTPGQKYRGFIDLQKSLSPETQPLKGFHERLVSNAEAMLAFATAANKAKAGIRAKFAERDQLQSELRFYTKGTTAYRQLELRRVEKSEEIDLALVTYKGEAKARADSFAIVATRQTEIGLEIGKYIGKQLANR